ncbi:MAG: CIA30 family protein [Pseudomonadota bacterium]
MVDLETLEILSEWRFVADTVMGGVSTGAMTEVQVAGRKAVRLTGQVSLENNGGFVQIATDLSSDGQSIDASAWSGIEIDVWGNGERYNIHLRTDDVSRPWQSYRSDFVAESDWTTLRRPFADFAAYRIDAPLDPSRLRRIGIVAIGREFEADVAVGGLRFFR